jgi:integrase
MNTRTHGNTDNVYKICLRTIFTDTALVYGQVGWDSVDKWLGITGPTSVRVNKSIIRRFMAWLKLNGGAFRDCAPDQLIDYQDNAVGKKRYDLLELVESFVQTQVATYGYKCKQLSTLRSFFAVNRSELPRDPRFNIRADIPPVRGDLKPEEIRLIVLKCNRLYRAVYLSMLAGAMGEEELIHWSDTGLKSLREQIKKGEDIVVIEQTGRKSKKNREPYFTLISGDALQAVKDYLAVRPEIGSNAIFISQYGDPLTKDALYQQWTTYAKKLGIIKPDQQTLEEIAQGKRRRCQIRFGKNVHEIRDTYRTLAAKAHADRDIAEFLMGHVIDRLGYNKAMSDVDWVKSEYQKFSKAFNVLTDLEPYGLVTKAQATKMVAQTDVRVETLEKTVEELTQTIKIMSTNLMHANIALDKAGTPIATDFDEIPDCAEVMPSFIENPLLPQAQFKDIQPIKVNQPRKYTLEEVQKIMTYMAKRGVVMPDEIPEMVQTVSDLE